MKKESYFISIVQILLYIIISIVFGIKDGFLCLICGLLITTLTILNMYFKGVIYHRKQYEQLKVVCAELIAEAKNKS